MLRLLAKACHIRRSWTWGCRGRQQTRGLPGRAGGPWTRSAPAVAECRAEQLAKLDALEEGAWEDVRNPGPKTSVTGKVITDGRGESLVDKTVHDAARQTILKTVRTRMDLLGLAAPRKSMNLQMTAELGGENETLQAQVTEAYQAALEERDRELADLRAQLAAAQASGPAALTVLAGKTEQEVRS